MGSLMWVGFIFLFLVVDVSGQSCKSCPSLQDNVNSFAVEVVARVLTTAFSSSTQLFTAKVQRRYKNCVTDESSLIYIRDPARSSGTQCGGALNTRSATRYVVFLRYAGELGGIPMYVTMSCSLSDLWTSFNDAQRSYLDQRATAGLSGFCLNCSTCPSIPDSIGSFEVNYAIRGTVASYASSTALFTVDIGARYKNCDNDQASSALVLSPNQSCFSGMKQTLGASYLLFLIYLGQTGALPTYLAVACAQSLLFSDLTPADTTYLASLESDPTVGCNATPPPTPAPTTNPVTPTPNPSCPKCNLDTVAKAFQNPDVTYIIRGRTVGLSGNIFDIRVDATYKNCLSPDSVNGKVKVESPGCQFSLLRSSAADYLLFLRYRGNVSGTTLYSLDPCAPSNFLSASDITAVEAAVTTASSYCGAVLISNALTLNLDEVYCGEKPTKKDIIVSGETTNVSDVIFNAPEGSSIFFPPGTYMVGVTGVKPAKGMTLWAEPGTVTWDSSSERVGPAITIPDEERLNGTRTNIRIYGIRFANYRVPDFVGVINMDNQMSNDAFNMIDPVWGYNPRLEWQIDCCEFDNWISTQNNGGAAIFAGNSIKVRGNVFHNGHGLGVWGNGVDLVVSQNRFQDIQVGPQDVVTAGRHGSIKLRVSKRPVIVDNVFKNVGGDAIWSDVNSEDVYIGYNRGESIGFSMVHYEVGGSGFVGEHNVGAEYGLVGQPSSFSQASAFYISTAGYAEYGRSGAEFRGNVAIVTPVQMASPGGRIKSGFFELDQSSRRNDEIVGIARTPVFGRMRDASGSGNPGQLIRRADNNRWFGNLGVNTPWNGVDMVGGTIDYGARTYETTTWQCNNMDGGRWYNTTVPLDAILYTQAEWRGFGFDSTTNPTINSAEAMDGGIVAKYRRAGPDLIVDLVSSVLPGVRFEVKTKACTATANNFTLRGSLFAGQSLTLTGSSAVCNDIVIHVVRATTSYTCIGAFLRARIPAS